MLKLVSVFMWAVSRARIEQAIKETIELAKPYDLELEMATTKVITNG